jgi:hypothetical protein
MLRNDHRRFRFDRRHASAIADSGRNVSYIPLHKGRPKTTFALLGGLASNLDLELGIRTIDHGLSCLLPGIEDFLKPSQNKRYFGRCVGIHSADEQNASRVNMSALKKVECWRQWPGEKIRLTIPRSHGRRPGRKLIGHDLHYQSCGRQPIRRREVALLCREFCGSRYR